jgi:hypothetical protein
MGARHGRIEDFPLGEHDTPDRLLIPERALCQPIWLSPALWR